MYGDRGAEYAQNEQHVNCVVGVYQNVGLYQNVGGCPSVSVGPPGVDVRAAR